MRWDDLQIFLAIAEHGSANAAAAAIGVSHSTLVRRVVAFERAEGVKLFDRLPDGYRPTPTGQMLLDGARQMDSTVHDLRRRLIGHDQELSGLVRVTSTDSVVASVLARHLAEFARQFPEITVELSMTNVRVDLNRLTADISVRPSLDPPQDLIGKKATRLAFAAYAHKAHDFGENPDLADLDRWIGISGELLNSPVQGWFAENVSANAVVARANTFVAVKELALADGGAAAILPCCLGDTAPDLSRLTAPIPALNTTLWVLTHPDLRTTARLRALFDFLVKALRSDRDLIEGRAEDVQS